MIPFHELQVWDVQTSKVLLTLKGHANTINSVAFSPDGNRLASAGGDVTVWDVQSGKELFTLKDAGWSVAYSPDGKRLASVSGLTQKKKYVKVWDAQTGEDVLTIESAFECVAFSPDGKSLATASYDKTAKVWDANTGKELLTLKGHTQPVLSVAFSPDGTTPGRRFLGQHDFHMGRADGLTTLLHPGRRQPRGLQPGQQTARLRERERHCDPGMGCEERSGIFSPSRDAFAGVHSLAFSTDVGKQLAAAGYDVVRVWDVQSPNPLLLQGVGAAVVAFSPDGKRLASSGRRERGNVKVWDAPLNGKGTVHL